MTRTQTWGNWIMRNLTNDTVHNMENWNGIYVDYLTWSVWKAWIDTTHWRTREMGPLHHLDVPVWTLTWVCKVIWLKNTRYIGSSCTVSHQHEHLNVSAGSLTGQMTFNIGQQCGFCQHELSSASASYLSLRRTINTGGSCGVSLQCELSNVVAGYVNVKKLSTLWATKEFLYCVHFQMTIKYG